MAKQEAAFDSTNLAPSRYTEQHAPQFTGGSTDPGTGNILPATRAQIGGDNPPPPAKPSTQLGSIEAAPKDHSSTDAILSGVGQGVAAVGAKALSSFGGKSGSDNPLDRGSSGNVSSMTGGSSSNSGGGSNWASQPWLAPSGNPTSSTTGDFAPSNTSFAYGGSGGGGGDTSAPSGSGYSGGGGYTAGAVPAQPSTDFLGGTSGGNDGGGIGGGASTDTVICSELHRQGFMDEATFAADQAFGAWVRSNHPAIYDGYRLWADHVVRAMQRSPRVSRAVAAIAKPWAATMAVKMGRNGYPPLHGLALYYGGNAMCFVLGHALTLRRYIPTVRAA